MCITIDSSSPYLSIEVPSKIVPKKDIVPIHAKKLTHSIVKRMTEYETVMSSAYYDHSLPLMVLVKKITYYERTNNLD